VIVCVREGRQSVCVCVFVSNIRGRWDMYMSVERDGAPSLYERGYIREDVYEGARDGRADDDEYRVVLREFVGSCVCVCVCVL